MPLSRRLAFPPDRTHPSPRIPLSRNPIAPSNQAGAWSYNSWVENGLAVIRDRDEVYMRIRYTF